MSFTWFRPEGPLRTREQIAREVHAVSLARGLDELATVIALMTISTEVGTGTGDNRKWWCPANDRVPATKNFPHDSKSDDNRSSGYFQQQPGPNGEPWWGSTRDEMTLSRAANTFLERLDDGYSAAANSPLMAGQFAQRVQQSAFPDRYAEKWDEAWTVLRRALNETPTTPEVPVTDNNRPDFNEWPMWSPNNSSRGGTKVDLWILHTQEGGGGDSAAEDLAKYLQGNNVSYHYTASQASDGGVTVVDVVDTDYASWSVLSANSRSINFCFAGSRASWTRDQWMKQSKAIDAAAYLAVQDCKKYGIPLVVIGTGGKYSTARAGVTDHQYVTKVLGDGTHTDVGAGFPVDYFTERFNFWASGGQTTPPVTEKQFPKDYSDRELLERVAVRTDYIYDQLGPGFDQWGEDGDLGRNSTGLRRTFRAGLAALIRKVGA